LAVVVGTVGLIPLLAVTEFSVAGATTIVRPASIFDPPPVVAVPWSRFGAVIEVEVTGFVSTLPLCTITAFAVSRLAAVVVRPESEIGPTAVGATGLFPLFAACEFTGAGLATVVLPGSTCDPVLVVAAPGSRLDAVVADVTGVVSIPLLWAVTEFTVAGVAAAAVVRPEPERNPVVVGAIPVFAACEFTAAGLATVARLASMFDPTLVANERVPRAAGFI